MYRVIQCLIYFTIVLQSVTCIDYDGWLNIEIQHSINCREKFCKRGSISLRSLRSGTSVVDQIDFNKRHIDELKKLAENDEFYTIRSIVTSAENNKGTEFSSSMKAQSFLDSGLSDIINAWVLPTGSVVAVNFQAVNSTQDFTFNKNVHKINSNFFLRYIDQAPAPDTATYIQKLERERDAREKGELKDNRSFLAKYWMYIVPIAIFVMISGASNPETGGQPARQ